MRGCLGLSASSVGELYSNTDIDALVLDKVRESLIKGPLTAKDRDWLGYIERELLARPSSSP